MHGFHEGERVAARYRLRRRLGEGATASAWEAQDRATGRLVALKLLSDPRLASTLRGEFDRLAGLAHPRLAEVEDFGFLDDGRCFYTSRVVRGADLAAFARTQRDVDVVRRVIGDVADALGFLHDLGLRHGDIKPANILVEAGRGVVIDLGCARPHGSPLPLAGTPRYLAPEMLDRESVDGRADLYALGVTLGDLEAHIELPEALASLRGRLVAPLGARPADAGEVLEALGLPARDPARVLAPPRLIEREELLRAMTSALDALHERRPASRVLNLVGPRGSGRSRLLREMKWSAQRRGRAHVAVAQDHALFGLLERAEITARRPLAVLDAIADLPPQVWLIDDAGELYGDEADLLAALRRSLANEACESPLLLVTANAQILGEGLSHPVAPLSREGVRRFVGAEREPLANALYEASGGMPGVLTELLATLGASASVSAVADAAEARRGALRAGERERLSRLPGPQRDALLEVACAGERDAAHTPVGAELVTAGWLLRREQRLFAPRAEAIRRAVDAETLRATYRRLASQASDAARKVEYLARAGDTQAAEALVPAEAIAGLAWRRAARALRACSPRVAAKLLARTGEPAAAIELLEAEPDLSAAERLLLAECRLHQEDVDDALAELEAFGEGACGAGAQVANLRARCLMKRGDHEGARVAASAGLLALQGTTPDPSLEGSLHQSLGMAASYLGDHEAAESHLERAAELRATDNPRELVRVRSYQAIDAFRRGDRDAAAQRYATALAVAEAHGIDEQIGHAALNVGTVRHHAGDWGGALRFYERGQRAALALGQEAILATLDFDLAKLYADIGAFERARVFALRCEAACGRLGQHFLQAAAWSILGEIALHAGDLREAERRLRRAQDRFEAQGAGREAAELELLLAEVGRRRGARVDGLPRAQEALRSGAADLLPQLALLRARSALDEGDPEEARRALEDVEAEDAPLRAELEALRAKVWEALGAPLVAADHQREARRLWERIAATLAPALRETFWAHPLRGDLSVSTSLSAEASGTPRSARVEKLERLLAINRRLSSSLDTNEVLRLAMDAAVELTGAERGFLVLRRESGELDVPVARNLDRERVGRSHSKFSRSIAEDVVARGEPVLSVDARHDARFQGNESVHAMRLRSVLAVPIPSPEGVAGALYLDNRFQRGRFDTEDVEVLQAFADQLAIALRNARMLARLQEQAEALEGERRRVEALSQGQAAQIDELLAEVEAHRATLERRAEFGQLIGRSAAMRQVLGTLERVVDSPLSVLVTGESGTGKELVARAVHSQSSRAAGAFVALNCGALPEALLESELFGHVKGAFTGAESDKQGLMERASGGTLFLDELGEMSLAMQVKLLRALENREVRPVGGASDRPVDFRLVCATNRDLEAEVHAGRFRADLFYRVGVVAVRLPPLRERLEDMPELVAGLLERVAQELGTETPMLHPGAMRRLLAHSWPGNVRELLNVLRSAAVMGGDPIRVEDLTLGRPSAPASDPDAQEKARIRHALHVNDGKPREAAAQLGISRATLYRRMKRLGIPPQRRPRRT